MSSKGCKRITDDEIDALFRTEKKAEAWFIDVFYGNREEMFCLRCGCTDINHGVSNHPTMPFHCKRCRKFFSIKTGTIMERSKIPLRKWAKNFYKQVCHLRGIACRGDGERAWLGEEYSMVPQSPHPQGI